MGFTLFHGFGESIVGLLLCCGAKVRQGIMEVEACGKGLFPYVQWLGNRVRNRWGQEQAAAFQAMPRGPVPPTTPLFPCCTYESIRGLFGNLPEPLGCYHFYSSHSLITEHQTYKPQESILSSDLK